MADIQHVDITDPQIHEPKGASTASANTVYVADGNGSGDWNKVTFDAMDTDDLYTDIQSNVDDGTLSLKGRAYQTVMIDDVSTADSVIIPVIQDCTVIGGSVVLGGTITAADAKVSFKNASGGSMGTDVTVAYDGSGKGDQFAFTATANNELVGPTWIEVATDGASTTAMPIYITVEYEYTLNQTLSA